jgi:hypothetical protein
MPHHDHHDCSGCDGIQCGAIVNERNRYFTGKYMTARDFQGEQDYFLSRMRLHNRMLHGWGIVCGLEVERHRDPRCRDWVIVRPGIAIDCCGRELVLDREKAVRLSLLPGSTEEGAPTPDSDDNGQPGQGYDGDQTEPDSGAFLVCLSFKEERIEYVPALYHQGSCDPKHLEPNRVRETVSLAVCSLDEVEADCWIVPGSGMDAPCRHDCGDKPAGPTAGCLQPVCPCGEMVPLARIVYPSADPDGAFDFDIDMDGRRLLTVAPQLLTHIVGINWEHGGEVTVSQLREEMGGRLEVRFDRVLAEADERGRTGVNEHTFFVQYVTAQRGLETLAPHPDYPPAVEDDCTAVFSIDPDAISPRNNIGNSTVYVSLRCDFILDCHRTPVDGEHLAGRLPSGDGIPGGVFESWFRVVPDRR